MTLSKPFRDLAIHPDQKRQRLFDQITGTVTAFFMDPTATRTVYRLVRGRLTKTVLHCSCLNVPSLQCPVHGSSK